MKHILTEIFENALYEFYNNELLSSKKKFEKIIDLDDDFDFAYYYLGRINEELGNGSIAGEMYSKYMFLGLSSHNSGDYETTVRIFNDLILQMPLHSQFYDYRATAYSHLNEISKSKRDKQTKFAFDSDNRTRDIYLFIDTETTGVPKNWDAPMSDLGNWPRIVEIACILSDDEGNIIYEDDWIIEPEGYKIPLEASGIHGITDNIAKEHGVSVQNILWKLLDMARYVDFVVAHNINFDYNVLGAEFLRKEMKFPFKGINQICTMESTTKFCKIEGPYGYKWPTLNELYFKLFQKEIQEAHNASSDINATFGCFWELRKNQII